MIVACNTQSELLLRRLSPDESITELRALSINFKFHADNFRDWAKQGGPINPIWAVETTHLRNDLHRAQCRAARRISEAERSGNNPRCLGAFLVYRQQRAWAERLRKRRRKQEAEALARGAPPSSPSAATQPHRHRRQGSSLVPSDDVAANDAADDEYELQRQHLEELAACNAVGKFERFGDRDIAFICDFCDGHVVWDDLESMPSIRIVDEEILAAAADPATPATTTDTAAPPSVLPTTAPAAPRIAGLTPAPADMSPSTTHWQATGFSVSSHKEKSIVFAPLAIANHVAPGPGQWVARLRCAACDEPPADYTPPEGEEEDEGGGGWAPDDELVFEDLDALQEHLEWRHTGTGVPAMPAASDKCVLM